MRNDVKAIIVMIVIFIIILTGSIRLDSSDFTSSYTMEIIPDENVNYSIIVPCLIGYEQVPRFDISSYNIQGAITATYTTYNNQTGILLTSNTTIRMELKEHKKSFLSMNKKVNLWDFACSFKFIPSNSTNISVDFSYSMSGSDTSYYFWGLVLDSEASYDAKGNCSGYIASNQIIGTQKTIHSDMFSSLIGYIPYCCIPIFFITIMSILIVNMGKQHRRRSEDTGEGSPEERNGPGGGKAREPSGDHR